jgi:hypothetical protein
MCSLPLFCVFVFYLTDNDEELKFVGIKPLSCELAFPSSDIRFSHSNLLSMTFNIPASFLIYFFSNTHTSFPIYVLGYVTSIIVHFTL